MSLHKWNKEHRANGIPSKHYRERCRRHAIQSNVKNKHSDLERTPSTARFLTTASEIASFASEGMLSTQIVGFVVNCPFVEVDGVL
jgi:hypothetical protein